MPISFSRTPWLRVLSICLMLSITLGTFPAAPPVAAVDATTPATTTSAAPLPAPAHAPLTANIPIPDDAESTSYPADYVDTLRTQYDARHTVRATAGFDGRFAMPSYATHTIPGPIELTFPPNAGRGGPPVTTTLTLPPGQYHQQLTADVTLSGSNIVIARVAIFNPALGRWEENDLASQSGGGTSEQTGTLSLGSLAVPQGTPITLELRCYRGSRDVTGQCTFRNFRFTNDAPGWQPTFVTPTSRWVYGVTAALGGLAAVPERDTFLGITTTQAGKGARYHASHRYQSGALTMPTIQSTDVVTASVWWARHTVDDTPFNAATGIGIHFRPQGSNGTVPLLQITDLLLATSDPVDVLEDWSRTTSGSLTSQLDAFSGQAGTLELTKTLGGTDHILALDDIELYVNGDLAWAASGDPLPADQLVGQCSCESCGQAQLLDNDPVNTCQGSFNIATSDLSMASSGPALTFGRSYTSLLADPATYPTTPMGPGWRQRFDHRLTLPSQVGGEPDTLIYEAPTGNRLRYRLGDDGTYRAVTGVRGTLVVDGSGYTLTRRDQSVLVFDSQGRLTEQRTSEGHQQTLSYYSGTGQVWDGHLQQVTDVTTGRTLTLTYQNLNGAARLASVADHTNRTVSYTYTPNGDLETVTDLRGGVTTYGYAGSTHLLTTVTDPLNAVQVTNTYDLTAPNRPVIQQVERSGRQITYAYAQTATGTKTTMTHQRPGEDPEVVVDHYRADGTFEFRERNGRFARYTTFDGTLTPSTTVDGNGQAVLRQHTPDGLPTQVTNATGETTTASYRFDQRPALMTTSDDVSRTLHYDNQGNLTKLEQTGDTLQLTTIYSYTVENRLAARQTPDGVVTAYTYTTDGQLRETTVGVGTPEAQTTQYTYDALGRLTDTTVGVGTALERVDVTEYHADNTVARTIRNYDDGTFDPATPAVDVVRDYGYDLRGRPIWTRDSNGRYDVTRYDAAGRVAWTAQNLVLPGWDGTGPLPTTPPAFDPATPDQNVATLYGYDQLDRTVLVTQTGILDGSFDPLDRTFDAATTRVTHTEYDKLSRPVTVTQNYQPGEPINTLPDVNVQTLTYYDGAGNVTWRRDALGRWTHTHYDAVNRPITTIRNYENGDPLTVDAANQSWTDGNDTDLITVMNYDDAGRVDRTVANYVDGTFTATEPITDRVTLTAYDGLSRMVQTTTNHDPSQSSRTDTNRVQTTSYDATTGQVLGHQDTLGRWMRYRYDGLGRVQDTIANYVDGNYDPTATDADLVTRTYFDTLGRVDRTIVNAVNDLYDPTATDEDITTRTTYDGVGRVIATTANYVDGGPTDTQTNVTTTTTYDGLGRIVTTADATGATTAMGYDGLSRTTVMTDSLNRVTTMGYDGVGAQRWTQRPDGQLTLTALDGLGRPVTTIVNYQNGVVGSNEPVDQDLISQSRYDRAGRLIETIDPAGRVTQFSYDLQDRLVAVTENVTTTCAPTAPDCNTTTRYQYDRVGNRTAIIDANGHVRRFGYDAASQQVEAFDGLNRRTGWSYDQGGRMVAQDDPRGTANDLTWTYDGLDRLTDIDATNLDAIGIGYDALGRRTTLTDGTGTTTFTPDPLGRVTQVTAPNTGTVGYSYTARGERSQLTYPDGTVVDYRYLADGRLDTVTEGSTTLADYGYDALGRLDQATMGNGAVTSYTYDNADRLRDLHTTVGSSTVTRFEYEVDRLGLRTQSTETLSGTVRTIDYAYDGLLRLTGATESPGTSYSYSYDRVGNRTDGGRTYNAANEVISFTYDDAGNLLNDGSTSYSYDALGRLTQQGSTNYTYNGDGVLVGRGSTSYTQDLLAPLEQVLNDGTTNTIYGLARMTSGTNTWYQHDGVGSVRAVLDGAGAVQSTTSYDPWGVPTAGSVDPFGFTGELHDGELVHLRARWYNPSIGTFTSRDPFAGFDTQPYSLHPYQYAYSNPVLWTDPSGRCVGWIWDDPTCEFIGWDRVQEGDLNWEDGRAWGGAFLDLLPGVGDAKGLIEVFTGCDMVTGEDLGHWRWLGLLLISEVRQVRHIDHVTKNHKHFDDLYRNITGARRSPLKRLSSSEIQELENIFREIGGDPTMLRFNEGSQTGYIDGDGIINVRGDVLPLENTPHPRSRMSSRAVLAHELAHAHFDGTPLPPGSWNDEFRASYWAAKNTPNLSDQDRVDLIADAIERAREAGVSINLNDFMRRTLYGDWEIE